MDGLSVPALQAMPMNKPILAICAALSVVGCGTTYQKLNMLGGVQGNRISDDVAQVTARGNPFTDPDAVQRYVLRRAAEETLADGYDLFRVVADLDRTRSIVGSFAYATGGRGSIWGPAVSVPIVKPGETIIIKMSKGPRPNPMPDGQFDAREVIRYLAPPAR